MLTKNNDVTIVRSINLRRHLSDIKQQATNVKAFFRQLLSKDIKAISMKTMLLSEQLLTSTNRIEVKFLTTGKALQSIYENTLNLTEDIQHTALQMSGEKENAVLSGVYDLVNNTQEAIVFHKKAVAQNLEKVGVLVNQLDALNNGCDQIDRIAMNLRVVGLNIGIEATRFELAKEMFTVVSEEIIHLSEKVADIGNRVREDIRIALNEQEEIFNTISIGLNRLTQLSQKTSEAVESSMQQIDNFMLSCRGTFERVSERFMEVSSQVGEIVAAMQFHDSMRQRIEHISTALQTVCGDLQKKKDKPKRMLLSRASLQHMHSVLFLQEVQLADVISEVNNIHLQVTTAFSRMGTEVTALMQDIQSSATQTCNDGSCQLDMETASTELISVLKELTQQVSDGNNLSQKIHDSVIAATKIGNRFEIHLKTLLGISFETQIKALNAIVKSGHLNEEGRTLEVLAQAMNSLSGQTGEFVSKVEARLSRIGDFSRELAREKSDSRSVGFEKPHAINQLHEMLSTEVDKISRSREYMHRHIKDVSVRSETLTDGIQNTVAELAFLPAFSNAMAEHLLTLTDACRILMPFKQDKDDVVTSQAEKFAESYTMERERNIHKDVLLSVNETDSDDKKLDESEFIFRDSVEALRTDDVVYTDTGSREEKRDEFGENVELF